MTRAILHTTFQRIALAFLVGSAASAFGISHRAWAVYLLLLPCGLSPFVELGWVSSRLAAWTKYFSWAALGGMVLIALLTNSFFVIPGHTAARLAVFLGYSLALLSALFLFAPRIWQPSATLFPATLGTFLAAGLNPGALFPLTLTLAGAALFAYLALDGAGSKTRTAAPPVTPRRLMRLGSSGCCAFVFAWGLIRLLPWAQGRIEAAGTDTTGSVLSRFSSFSTHTSLGDLEQLKLSPRVVMRVWTARPQKLRGRVFSRFDGKSWYSQELSTTTVGPATRLFSLEELAGWLESIPGRLFMIPGKPLQEATYDEAIRTKVIEASSFQDMLFLPGEPLLVRAPVPYLRANVWGSLSPPVSSSAEIYGVINCPERDIVQPEAPNSAMFSAALSFPEDTDSRLKELAGRLGAGTCLAEERIVRTVSLLQNECHYSLTVGKFHSRQPVAEFLFEKKYGYCEYFASAAALLLRLQGVPSLYVTGFNVQEGNRQGDHYVVREADAHAWIEAYIPGTGWVQIDPTPESEYEATHAGLKGGWMENTTEWLRAQWAESSIRISAGAWRATLGFLGAALNVKVRRLFVKNLRLFFALLAFILSVMGLLAGRGRLRGSRWKPKVGGEDCDPALREVTQLMSRLDGLWARAGFGRPASRAPLEHLASIPPDKISAVFHRASRRIVQCFYQCCFASAHPSPAEIRELKCELERASTALRHR